MLVLTCYKLIKKKKTRLLSLQILSQLIKKLKLLDRTHNLP
jgi:hypothetical protein